jgi:hypothetical protein
MYINKIPPVEFLFIGAVVIQHIIKDMYINIKPTGGIFI